MKKFTMKELADAWGVSVPATWKRVGKIQKEDENNGTKLINVIKEPINNKLTTLIEIEDSVFNRYFQQAETSPDIAQDAEMVDKIIEFSDLTQARMLETTNKYAEDIRNLMSELANAKASSLLLEDKAGREGMFLQEIRTNKETISGLEEKNSMLKEKNNNLKIVISVLLTLLIVSIFLIGFMVFKEGAKDVPVVDKQPVNTDIINVNKHVKNQSVTPSNPANTGKNKK